MSTKTFFRDNARAFGAGGTRLRRPGEPGLGEPGCEGAGGTRLRRPGEPGRREAFLKENKGKQKKTKGTPRHVATRGSTWSRGILGIKGFRKTLLGIQLNPL